MRPLKTLVLASLVMPSLLARAQSPSEFSTRINAFGLRWLERAAAIEPAGNRVISPVSTYLALAMATAGAEGATRDLLHDRLGVDSAAMLRASTVFCQEALSVGDGIESSEARVLTANGVWTSSGDFGGRPFALNPRYRGELAQNYRASVDAVDFRDPATTKRIDGWVSQHTRGEIPSIVSREEIEDLMLLILNATYFKGFWVHDFDEVYNSKRQTFHLADGTEVVRPMIATSGNFRFARNADEEAIEIPFRNTTDREYVFLALVPKLGTSLAKYRNASAWDAARAVLAAEESRFGRLKMPTFEFEDGYQLNQGTLLTRSLGLAPAFADSANFDGMKTLESASAKLAFVKNLNRIALDGNGVKAAAATAVGVAMGGGLPKKPDFEMSIDRPYAFAVAEKRSGLLVFVGEINDPSAR